MGSKQSGGVEFEAHSFIRKFDDLSEMYGLEDSDESAAFVQSIWKHFHKVFPDGQMTRTEFVRDNRKMKGGSAEFWNGIFDEIDTDGNGSIDFREYLIFLLLSRNQSTEATLDLIFSLLDSDGNGTLERDEVEMFFKVLIDGYDQTISEILELPETGKRGERLTQSVDAIFKKMDENGDGLIQRDEFVGFIQREPQFKKVFVNSFDQMNVLFKDTVVVTKAGDAHVSRKASSKSLKIGSGSSGGLTRKASAKKLKLGFVKHEEDKLLKELDDTEFGFYEEFVQQLPPEERAGIFPEYHGRELVATPSTPTSVRGRGAVPKAEAEDDHHELSHCVSLENLTAKMEKPCILKLATALQGKKRKRRDNCTMKVWGIRAKTFLNFQFKKINEDLLSKFVYNGVCWYLNKINSAIKQLERIEEFIKKHGERFNFDQVTLIFVYEGHEEDPHEPVHDEMIVRLVDFSHIEERSVLNTEVPFNKAMLEKVNKCIELFSMIRDEYEIIV